MSEQITDEEIFEYTEYWLYHAPTESYVDGPFLTVKGARCNLSQRLRSSRSSTQTIGIYAGKRSDGSRRWTHVPAIRSDFEVREVLVKKYYETSYTA